MWAEGMSWTSSSVMVLVPLLLLLRRWCCAALPRARRHPPLSVLRLPDHERSRWMNLGLWESKTDSGPSGSMSFVEACERMAHALADTVGLRNAGVRTLCDVGCGWGDQLVVFADHLKDKPGAHITAVERNADAVQHISTEHRKHGTVRITAHNTLGGKLPNCLATGSFDAVTALDCAYHFRTREDFLARAYRLLRAGGRVGLADIVSTHTDSEWSWSQRALLRVMCAMCDVPAANMLYNQAGYQQRLEQEGFGDVRFQDVTKEVLLGFADFTDRQYLEWGALTRLNLWIKPLVTAAFCRLAVRRKLLRFVLVSATK